MADEKTEASLVIVEMDLQGQLATLGEGRPFKWYDPEIEKQASECFDAARLLANLAKKKAEQSETKLTSQEVLNQARLQLREVIKLTFVDFLKRHGMCVNFGESLPKSYSLDTYEVFMPPETFKIIEVLAAYPYSQVFGKEGLASNAIRIGEKKGRCALELRLFDQVCTVELTPGISGLESVRKEGRK